MKTKTRVNNQKPYCPFCAEGYMLLNAVTLETCPETEADIEFTYKCNHCYSNLSFYQSELEAKGFDYIGIAPVKAMTGRDE